MKYKVRINMEVELGPEFKKDAAQAQNLMRGIPLYDYLKAAYTGVCIDGQMEFRPRPKCTGWAVIIEEA